MDPVTKLDTKLFCFNILFGMSMSLDFFNM